MKTNDFKSLAVLKKRDGERRGTVITTFCGENAEDAKMLDDIKTYMREYIKAKYNALTVEELDEMFENFDGDFYYDVYSYYSEYIE